jgi:hypothetical protein
MLERVEAGMQEMLRKAEPCSPEPCGDCYRTAVHSLALCGDLRLVLEDGSAEGERVASAMLHLWLTALSKGWTVTGFCDVDGGAL